MNQQAQTIQLFQYYFFQFLRISSIIDLKIHIEHHISSHTSTPALNIQIEGLQQSRNQLLVFMFSLDRFCCCYCIQIQFICGVAMHKSNTHFNVTSSRLVLETNRQHFAFTETQCGLVCFVCKIVYLASAAIVRKYDFIIKTV